MPRFVCKRNVDSRWSFCQTVFMENNKRTWAKALTWQTSGLIIMTGVNYLFLGSLQQSLGLSALLTGMGLITYVIHERLWARVRWGMRNPAGPSTEAL
jgi:uncharacterized membrane protein